MLLLVGVGSMRSAEGACSVSLAAPLAPTFFFWCLHVFLVEWCAGSLLYYVQHVRLLVFPCIHHVRINYGACFSELEYVYRALVGVGWVGPR